MANKKVQSLFLRASKVSTADVYFENKILLLHWGPCYKMLILIELSGTFLSKTQVPLKSGTWKWCSYVKPSPRKDIKIIQYISHENIDNSDVRICQ